MLENLVVGSPQQSLPPAAAAANSALDTFIAHVAPFATTSSSSSSSSTGRSSSRSNVGGGGDGTSANAAGSVLGMAQPGGGNGLGNGSVLGVGAIAAVAAWAGMIGMGAAGGGPGGGAGGGGGAGWGGVGPAGAQQEEVEATHVLDQARPEQLLKLGLAHFARLADSTGCVLLNYAVRCVCTGGCVRACTSIHHSLNPASSS